MSLKKNTCKAGFTLIEMIIAMTILALVVTVLYLAFSTAGRIWSRQQIKGGRGEHEAALSRLLSDDLQNLVPYSFSWEKGQGFFFAYGPSALFYATTSGYGARQRSAEGLYFTCCYLQESEEKEGFSLFLAKEMGPKNFLVEALWDFIQGPEKSLVVNESLREASLLILDGLTEASFAVVGDPEKLNLPEGEIEEGALIESGVTRNWSRKTLPQNLLFRYENSGGIKRNL
ncbi:MAG: prepilin-type N-terminal cleavage/methylation domain-containing protein, partial [Pseudomonadota bacterium]|nr:prepilin-type N-terminal cleavage/methylation domain-containing protein [Pseudomonadota bacterium]